MTRKEHLALELLTSDREWWGGLALAHQSGGRLTRGDVESAMARFVRNGWVESQLETGWAVPGGTPQRKFRVTDSGARALEEHNALRSHRSSQRWIIVALICVVGLSIVLLLNKCG